MQQKNGMAIAALVLGIVGLLFFWIPVLGLILAIVGIFLGAMSLKSEKHGFAVGGLICSIVGTVLAGLFNACFLITCTTFNYFSSSASPSSTSVCAKAFGCTDCTGSTCTCYYFDDGELETARCPKK